MKNIYDQFLYKDIKASVTNEDFETNNILRVCFQLGNICTYDCSYCSDGNKNGSFKWPEFSIVEKIIREIDRIYKASPYNKKEIIFEYIGGEVTLWKNFEKLLILVNELGNKSWLVTNGVRPLRWWEEYGKYFDLITLSAHLEFSDVEHLCKVSNILVENEVLTTLAIMMYPPKWDECLNAIDYFTKNSTGDSITLLPLTDFNSGEGLLWNYTTEEFEFIRKNSSINPINNKLKKNLTEVSFWRNSLTKKILPRPGNNVIAFSENNFYNWKCYAGIDTLYLENNGDVRVGAMCRPVPPLGNWKKDDVSTIKWPFEPVICKYIQCNCGHDIRARKFKINDNNI